MLSAKQLENNKTAGEQLGTLVTMGMYILYLWVILIVLLGYFGPLGCQPVLDPPLLCASLASIQATLPCIQVQHTVSTEHG